MPPRHTHVPGPDVAVLIDAESVLISAALWGGPPQQAVRLNVAFAYELGRNLVDAAEWLLAGCERPWDSDPGRVPFGSRGRRGGQPEAAPRRVGLEAGPPGARIRPVAPPGSGA